EYDNTKPGIHYTLMILARDRRIIFVGIHQNLVKVLQVYVGQSEGKLHGRGRDEHARLYRYGVHLPGNELLAVKKVADLLLKPGFVSILESPVVIEVALKDVAIQLRNRQHPGPDGSNLPAGIAIASSEMLTEAMKDDGDDNANDQRAHHTS